MRRWEMEEAWDVALEEIRLETLGQREMAQIWINRHLNFVCFVIGDLNSVHQTSRSNSGQGGPLVRSYILNFVPQKSKADDKMTGHIAADL
ncbi:MAG: hypothetical protein LQ348_006186 [Seirophora lacunosa]|nr:MAG: hypothetical protein LQ348_006186 [Seirophora lacunosa]